MLTVAANVQRKGVAGIGRAMSSFAEYLHASNEPIQLIELAVASAADGSADPKRGINFLVAVFGLFGISKILLTMEERLALRGPPASGCGGAECLERPAEILDNAVNSP